MAAGVIDRGRVSVLGVGVDAVDMEAVVARVIAAAEEGRPYAVSALAVHGVMTGVDDPEHLARLAELDLVTPDGQPVRWAMNWLHGTEVRERVYGPRLMLEVCRAAATRELPIFLYGSTAETLRLLAARLPVLVPGLTVAGTRPSTFAQVAPAELDVIAESIRASGAAICFVGLGCPRQEVFVYENAGRLSMPALAVGAAFDFHAGLRAEPPAWVQRAGLQWLQRLAGDPRRLWRRYLVLNPRYVWGVVRQRTGRPDPQPATPRHRGDA